MRGIFLRELRLLLWSPSGGLLLAVWSFLTGALFLLELVAFEQAEQRALQLADPGLLALLDFNDLLLAAVNNHLVVVLLFIGPLIGARLFADGAARDWLLHAAPSWPPPSDRFCSCWCSGCCRGPRACSVPASLPPSPSALRRATSKTVCAGCCPWATSSGLAL